MCARSTWSIFNPEHRIHIIIVFVQAPSQTQTLVFVQAFHQTNKQPSPPKTRKQQSKHRNAPLQAFCIRRAKKKELPTTGGLRTFGQESSAGQRCVPLALKVTSVHSSDPTHLVRHFKTSAKQVFFPERSCNPKPKGASPFLRPQWKCALILYEATSNNPSSKVANEKAYTGQKHGPNCRQRAQYARHKCITQGR